MRTTGDGEVLAGYWHNIFAFEGIIHEAVRIRAR